MALKHVGYVDLPQHAGPGGFDHAAVDRGRGLLFVAHTANDAVDVVDVRAERYLRSVPDLKGVAGVLVHEPANSLFTSNRGENTLGVIALDSEERVDKVAIGIRPNGLAYDPDRGIVLCANVGDPGVSASPSVTAVDVRTRSAVATVPMQGRTRWTRGGSGGAGPEAVQVGDDERSRLAGGGEHLEPGVHGTSAEPAMGR